MRDEAITVDPALSLADQAVSYLLRRIKVDVDLRYLMLHTEAFAKLCAAEARRTGTSAEVVEAFYSELAPHCTGDVPKVTRLNRDLEKRDRRIAELEGDRDEDMLVRRPAPTEAIVDPLAWIDA